MLAPEIAKGWTMLLVEKTGEESEIGGLDHALCGSREGGVECDWGLSGGDIHKAISYAVTGLLGKEWFW